MNRSYKSVYNEHTNTWVAVSEVSTARGKRSSSTKISLVAAALGFVGSISPQFASAQVAIDDGTSVSASTAVAVNTGDIAIGNKSLASGGNALAAGVNWR